MIEPINLCPFCGAYATRSCELMEEAGHCPWEMVDNMRDDRIERDCLAEEFGDD